MHDVLINGRHRPVASTWNELTRPLLLQVLDALYQPNDNETQLRLRLLAVLLQVPLLTVLVDFTPEQIIQIQWLTDFVLADLTLTAQRLPWVRRPRAWSHPLPRRYWGPRENFRNLRFLEFIFADSYFVAYAQDPTATRWLDQLVAVLYRPQRRPYRPKSPGYGGDRREDFNPVHVAARVAQLRHLPPAEKLAVATWYRGCRQQLERDYPLVFTPANEDAAAQASDGWAHVAREMSGGIFGTLEQTEQQLLRDVLARMQDDARRAQELKRLAEQNRP
ncbi:hypothetical protein JAO73_10425 [Hymenobacter sp. BT523]|uniref:hypothetical protein n=1 Tax=Hymenobacter sp. BT523 TaxID=2795725 RepID=UPI0018EC2910|nr:hypothetical protein [Hymenobacter sp. BT523]MBJ6109430.1 hypothetical protein [Hymenobacter sp. BT523]